MVAAVVIAVRGILFCGDWLRRAPERRVKLSYHRLHDLLRERAVPLQQLLAVAAAD